MRSPLHGPAPSALQQAVLTSSPLPLQPLQPLTLAHAEQAFWASRASQAKASRLQLWAWMASAVAFAKQDAWKGSLGPAPLRPS